MADVNKQVKVLGSWKCVISLTHFKPTFLRWALSSSFRQRKKDPGHSLWIRISHYLENHASCLGHLYPSVWWLSKSLPVLVKAVVGYSGYKCVQCTVAFHQRQWLNIDQQGYGHGKSSQRLQYGEENCCSHSMIIGCQITEACKYFAIDSSSMEYILEVPILTPWYLSLKQEFVHHLLYSLTFPTFSRHYLNSSKMHDIVSDTEDKKWRVHGHQLTSTRCNEGPLSGPSFLSEKDKGEGRGVTCSWEINTRFPGWTQHSFVPFGKQ